nr:integral membrane protein 1 [Arenicola marina]
MAEKSELPPVYMRSQEPERKVTSRKWLLGLLFYAGAVTAALVVMATMGYLYLDRLEQLCQQPHRVHYSPSGQTQEVTTNGERVVVDPAANKEVIYPSGEGLQGSIIVIDHNMGMIGMYLAATETCFLIGGIDSRLPNATELLAALQSDDGADLDPEYPVSLTYVKASDWPVQDLTLLPRELHAPCWGKPVSWLERSPESVQRGADRTKRRAAGQRHCGLCIDILVDGRIMHIHIFC